MVTDLRYVPWPIYKAKFMNHLRPDKDPFGVAIADYYAGRTNGKLIVLSDIAEEDFIDVAYLFRTLNEMPALEQKALQICKGSILDIGAGAGCHSMVLQTQKMEVTALEISPLAVGVMKKMGIRNTINADIFELKNTRYDTLLMLMNGIGITGNLEGYVRFLDFAKTLLNLGGQIIFDSADISYMQETKAKRSHSHRRYHREVKYRVRYGKTESAPFNWFFIDYQTAKDIAEKNGYAITKIYDGKYHNYLAKLYVK